jgi:DNA-binding MarR family transcriptional regulator
MYMHTIAPVANRRQSPHTLRSDAIETLAIDLGWCSRMASRRITGELDKGLAGTGLTSAQFGLLCLIASAPDDTLGGLAQRAGLKQSTMSRNVEILASAGLVELAMVEQDRRRRAVWLTESGARGLAAALPAWHAAHEALVARLGPAIVRNLFATSAALQTGDAP